MEEGWFQGKRSLGLGLVPPGAGVASTASGRLRSPGPEEATSQPSVGRMAVGQEGCRCQLPAANVHRSRAQAGPGAGPGASERLPGAEACVPPAEVLLSNLRLRLSTQSGMLHARAWSSACPWGQWDWRAGRRLGFGARRP